MLSLLQYDFKKSKKTMKTMMMVIIITSFLCLIMKLVGSNDNLLLAFFLELIILIITCISGFYSLFERNFAKRFLKDSIISYTAIKKNIIFLECITYTVCYIAISSLIISVLMMALFFNVQDQLIVTMKVTITYSDSTVLNMVMQIIFANIMILTLYCGILLCFWNIAKIKKSRSCQILHIIAIYLVWGGIILLSKLHIPVARGILIFILLGCLLMLIAYVLFMKKET